LRSSGKRRGRASMRMLPVGPSWRPARTVQIVCRAGGAGMAKGWQEECGISEEGVDILGWVEALPREARRELAATVEMLCRAQGYLSLHEDVVSLDEERRARQPKRARRALRREGQLAQVIRHPRWSTPQD